MGQTVKATVVGTVIIGVFMLLCTWMATNAAWDMARATRRYVDSQKVDVRSFILSEKRKAKEVFLEGVEHAGAVKK